MTITDMLGLRAATPTHQPSAKGAAGKHSASGFGVAMREALGSDAASRRGTARTTGNPVDHQTAEKPLEPNRREPSKAANPNGGATTPSAESASAESAGATGEAPADPSAPDHSAQAHSGQDQPGQDQPGQAQTESSQTGNAQPAGTELGGAQAGMIVGGIAAAIVADPAVSTAAAVPSVSPAEGTGTTADAMGDGAACSAVTLVALTPAESVAVSGDPGQTTSTTPAAAVAPVGTSVADDSHPSSGRAHANPTPASVTAGEALSMATVPAGTSTVTTGIPAVQSTVGAAAAAPAAAPQAGTQTGTPVAASPTTSAAAGILTSAVGSSGVPLTETAGEAVPASPTTPTVQATASAVDAGAASSAVATAAQANAPAASAPTPSAPTPSAPFAATAPTYATLTPQLARPIFTLAAAGAGEHVMTINVTPDNLGPVTVRAHIGADGIRLEVFAPTDVARDALRTILPDLRRDLAGSGMNANLSLSEHGEPADTGNSGGGPANGGQGGSGDTTRQTGNARHRTGEGNTGPSRMARNRYDGASTIDLLA